MNAEARNRISAADRFHIRIAVHESGDEEVPQKAGRFKPLHNPRGRFRMRVNKRLQGRGGSVKIKFREWMKIKEN